MSGPSVRRGGGAGDEVSTSNSDAAPSALPHALTPGARARLRRLLVGKAILEAVFVLALAAGFFYLNTNPGLEGAILSAGARRVEGWLAGGRDAATPVEVQLFVDGRFAASAVADREPAPGGSYPTGARGFVFEMPSLPEGEHEARVYAVHVGSSQTRRTLHQLGGPARFRVGPDGEVRPEGE